MATARLLRGPSAVSALVLAACSSASGPPLPEKFSQRSPVVGNHDGPPVDQDLTGTARFVHPLLDAFDVEGAISVASFLDGFYRAPASDGYDESVERIIAAFFGAGFGSSAGYTLAIAADDLPAPSWTPVSARISAIASDEAIEAAREQGVKPREGQGVEVELVRFQLERDANRVMLPIGAPSCDVQGAIALDLEALEEGEVFLTNQPLRAVDEEALAAGAAAVVSDYLFPYCVDPTGEGRDQDAIFSDVVRPGSTLPSFHVSPRVGALLRRAARLGTQVHLEAEVRTEQRPLRTVLATIEGSERPDEVVFVIGHVDGAGANDNAAGAGGVLELALTIKRLIEADVLARPRRSICFVFGLEQGAGRAALDEFEGAPVAALVADMIAASPRETGATALLERGWDPGAIFTLPPDAHTPWGAGSVSGPDIVPNGLSIVCREALIDVSYAEEARGGRRWTTREHPWEGGGDHDAFLAAGHAAALFWHFTDFSYQTSLDRMPLVDRDELRRTAVAIGAAALAVADARPTDLERHLDSLNLELRTRMDAVLQQEAGPDAERLWKAWFRGARFWLKALTAGEPLPAPAGLPDLVPDVDPDVDPEVDPAVDPAVDPEGAAGVDGGASGA